MQALRRVLTGAAVLLMLALLAAWQVPPRLEWGRYRGSIAAFASARLARGVTIGGQVSLSLLPQVVLTASEVKLADRGDGISARVGALRLQVQFWPLLRGHVVPRDLLLADPVVTVPWPLPDTAGAVPALAPGFAAGTEGGALHLGALTLTAVSASLHADPDTGAFGAQGTVSVQGRPCRFTALIGAAGRDGIAPLNLTLDGQGALQGTGGSFRGRLLGHGALQGTLQARGPDASKLLPAPAVPWRVQGAVQVSGGQLQAPDLQLMLADSPGQARVTLRMLPPARLDAAAKLGQFALGGWIAGLARPGLPIPVHLDVRAQAATWRGRALRDIALQLDLGGAEPGLVADATLPGDAKLHLSASLQESTTGAVLAGPLTLSAPDLPTTLTWLATKPGGAPPRLGAAPRPPGRPASQTAPRRPAAGTGRPGIETRCQHGHRRRRAHPRRTPVGPRCIDRRPPGDRTPPVLAPPGSRAPRGRPRPHRRRPRPPCQRIGHPRPSGVARGNSGAHRRQRRGAAPPRRRPPRPAHRSRRLDRPGFFPGQRPPGHQFAQHRSAAPRLARARRPLARPVPPGPDRQRPAAPNRHPVARRPRRPARRGRRPHRQHRAAPDRDRHPAPPGRPAAARRPRPARRAARARHRLAGVPGAPRRLARPRARRRFLARRRGAAHRRPDRRGFLRPAPHIERPHRRAEPDAAALRRPISIAAPARHPGKLARPNPRARRGSPLGRQHRRHRNVGGFFPPAAASLRPTSPTPASPAATSPAAR